MKIAAESSAPRSLATLAVFRAGNPFSGTMSALLKDPLTLFLDPYHQFQTPFRTRLGTRMHLVMAGPEANDFIWQNTELWSYSQRNVAFREELDSNYLIQLDGEVHRNKRSRLLKGFKATAFQPHLTAMSQVLLETIESHPNEEVDLKKICARFTVSMTSRALWQLDLPAGFEHEIIKFEGEMLMGRAFGLLRHLWYRRRAYRHLKQHIFTVINNLLDVHAANPPGDSDMLSSIMDGSISREELAADAFLLLEAGSEATAHQLLWMLMYVYQDANWLQELRSELRTWSPQQSLNINTWPKLKATILEIERLRPPVPFFILIPTDTFVFQNICVPRGTPILHAAALPHFSSWEDDEPEKFKPQRFLGTAASLSKYHSTFGGGAHACLGKVLARVQLMLTLATIIKNYDVNFVTTPSFRVKMASVLTPIEPTLPVQFISRV